MDGVARRASDGRAAPERDGQALGAVVETAHDGDSRYVVEARGHLGFASTPALEQELLPLSRRPAARVTLDLSRTEAIDCNALAVVLKAVVGLRSTGGDLRIVSPGESLRRRLSISGLDRLISVHEHTATASTS
jgi:anti-anti-sigma factor